MSISGKFALQLAESTDISDYAQPLSKLLFLDRDTIRENFLFCKALPEEKNRRGNISGRIRISLAKRSYVGKQHKVCTDGPAAMVGCSKGFVSRVKERHPCQGSDQTAACQRTELAYMLCV